MRTEAAPDAAVCGIASIGRQLPRAATKVRYRCGAYQRIAGIGTQVLQVARAALAGLPVRLGAYGDPAAVPTVVWQTVLAQSAMHAGYTHQWRTCDPALTALVHGQLRHSGGRNSRQRAAGWRTFTVRVSWCGQRT